MPRRLFALAFLLCGASASTAAQASRSDTVRLSVADAVTRVLRESDEVRLATSQLDVAVFGD